MHSRCTFRGKNPGESIILLYSLLGNLCSTSGAILSRQLHIQGKLRYCHPPPHINPEDFQPQHSEFLKTDVDFSEFSSTSTSHNKVRRIENVVDKNFFHQANVRALSKGVQSVMGYKPGCGPVPAPKPGKEVMEGKP
ncbi:hypothetical protein KUCAC02_022408 [Chaenocephalus aceratus]|uniref:Uncharacterized protein n=1 Tax=Chaenocephalus aceratus TaxID=36190 RepID=A0ACB9XN12_CHAAC|nr:hypothetical protein KUCAC02_022408 [Chaenocephalus aceratus]